MDRVIAAAILAMVIGILAGPKFIDFLRERELGQHIREEGPAGHVAKQGTPTMGGLLMLFAALIPFLLVGRYTLPGLAVLFVTFASVAVGSLPALLTLPPPPSPPPPA